MLGALVACALLPAVAGSAFAYFRARDELLDQGRAKLHRSAKRLALTLYDRLRQVEAQPDARDSGETHVGEALALEPGALGPLAGLEREHLAAGRSLLRTRLGAGGETEILLVRGDPGEPQSLRALRIAAGFLWRTPDENLLENDQEFCVFDGSGVPLHCSLPALAGVAREGRAVEAEVDGRRVLSSSWSVFLRPAFAAGDWHIVLAEPRDVVLAPVSSLRRSFPLLVALSLLLGLLLALPQIRRSLGPLRQLTLGARRIAERDFEARVAIHSGDEFEALGHAFNGMAAELGRQFHALEAKSEIDRSVLAARDLPEIAQVVLQQLPRVAEVSPVALVVLSGDEGGRARVFRPAGGDRVTSAEVELDPAVLTWLASPGTEGSRGASGEPALRAALAIAEPRIHVVALRAQGRLLGALVCCWSAAAADAAAPRGLADQIAVAVWNARMVEEIRYHAYYDGLTGLANRQLGIEWLRQALLQARRRDGQVAVLFLDLDRFKRVNDSLGHAAGDELLRLVGGRLVDTVRATDAISRPGGQDGAISRLGGDEFVVVLPEVRDLNGAASAAQRICEALRAPVTLQGREIFPSGSIGIAMFPHDGDSPDDLLKHADAAMYEAKRAGRDGFRFYREVMNAEATRHLTLETRLRKALHSQDLRVAYQPIVCPEGRTVGGVEALVRWTDAVLGQVSPPEMIAIAEESELIVALGEWILETACRQVVAWEREGLGALYVAVNTSPRQFTFPGFASSVGAVLQRTGLPPDRLVLEITETLLLSRVHDPARTLRELKAAGVRLSIDDFGTGYSSLAYLKEFPIDFLKIDRSFVKEIGIHPRDEAIVAAILELGHLLGLKVVAEGVETDRQLAFLEARACDAIQGYLLGRPMPADEIGAAIARIAESGGAARVAPSAG